MVAEFLREVQIPFDRNDGDLAKPAQIRDGAADILDDRRLEPSVGSSSSSRVGRMTKARPMASYLLLALHRSPPRRPSRILRWSRLREQSRLRDSLVSRQMPENWANADSALAPAN
jgi:hypothetical protein